ncbi:MAG: hypothetical protein P9M06_06545 [Candidatus Saelkia tenebricola]|nr:hypothetical protein [Candidatus Saelkia tenebricola]
MSIFIALALPQFNKGYQNIRFKSTANNIVSFLRVAQEKTLTEGNIIEVRFYPQDNKIVMRSGEKILEVLDIPDTAEIETTMFELLFEFHGRIIIFEAAKEGITPSFSGSLSLKDRSRPERKINIKLYGTGLIKIE